MKNIILTFVLFSLSCAIYAQPVKKVAVFDPEGSVMQSIRHIVREEISNAIVNNPDYDVVERSMIDKVLQESRFQTSGLVDDSEISELGRMMGADYVCYGSIIGIGANYYISMKMVDVVTAEVVAQRTRTTQDGLNDLISVTSGLANQLVSITERKIEAFLATDTKVEPEIEEIEEKSLKVRDIEPVREAKIEDSDYKGKYVMLALGLGNSYGGMGFRFQFRTGANFGFGLHAGVGYDPGSESVRASGGLKIFPYRGFYLNGQFGLLGRESYYDNWWGGNIDRNLYGPSFLVGGDWNWGRRVGFGFNAALGLSMALNARYDDILPAFDLGFVIRF